MTARPRVGVLALQGDVREHLAALTECGANAVPVRRGEEVDALQGIVLPGGESSTIDKLSRRFEVREPLVAALRAGLPAYGSCAGMIMLADRIVDGAPGQQTFGGLELTVRRNAFGRQVDSFETDLGLAGVAGPPVHAVFIRAPWVEELSDEVEVLARIGPDAPPAVAGRVVAVRQGPLVATAFHPEVTADRRIHQLLVDLARS